MDERRKSLGRRIARARRAAGYRSQAAFAAAIGIHETSVARAETGDPRVGSEVLTLIELGLNLPADATTRYLETGDDSDLDTIGSSAGWTERNEELMAAVRAFLREQGIDNPKPQTIRALLMEIQREKTVGDESEASG